MAKAGKNYGLLFLALLFTVLGVITIFELFRDTFWNDRCFSNFRIYSDTALISDKATQSCYCSKGQVVCEKKNALEAANEELEISDFVRNNLDFTSEYIAGGIVPELDSLPLKTDMLSIRENKGNLDVVLRQGQLCSVNNRPAVQIGLYNFTNGILTLMNVVNLLENLYTQPCTVQLTYHINSISLSGQKDFKLQFRSEDGEIVPAQICVYQGKIYNEKDNYIASDGCNICKCVNGLSRCSNDRVCTK